MKELIQNLAIKNYHKFQVRPLKDIEMLILVTSIYLLTKVILSCILHNGLEKMYEGNKLLTKCDLIV